MRTWIKIVLALIILMAVALGVWFFLFSKPIRPVEPIRSALDSSLIVPVSTMRIPIEFQLKDLEKMVNTKLKGVFIKEWLAVGDKKKDSIYLELERTNPIRFAWTPGELSAKVPLRISFRFKKKAIGIRIQNEKPIVAEVILNLKSKINLDDGWGINSTTTLEGIVWEMEPSIKIAFVQVNLRKVADNYLEKNQNKITRKFDSLSHELLDTRQIVQRIWNDIQKPIILKKTQPQIGLSAHAEELISRWTANAEGNISGMITLKAKVYAWFGEPEVYENVPIPKHKYAGKQMRLSFLVIKSRKRAKLKHASLK